LSQLSVLVKATWSLRLAEVDGTLASVSCHRPVVLILKIMSHISGDATHQMTTLSPFFGLS